jgi:hypothetical protein
VENQRWRTSRRNKERKRAISGASQSGTSSRSVDHQLLRSDGSTRRRVRNIGRMSTCAPLLPPAMTRTGNRLLGTARTRNTLMVNIPSKRLLTSLLRTRPRRRSSLTCQLRANGRSALRALPRTRTASLSPRDKADICMYRMSQRLRVLAVARLACCAFGRILHGSAMHARRASSSGGPVIKDGFGELHYPLETVVTRFTEGLPLLKLRRPHRHATARPAQSTRPLLS